MTSVSGTPSIAWFLVPHSNEMTQRNQKDFENRRKYGKFTRKTPQTCVKRIFATEKTRSHHLRPFLA